MRRGRPHSALNVLDNCEHLVDTLPARALRLIGGADRLREEIRSTRGLASSRRHVRTMDLARQLLAPDAAYAELATGRRMM